MSDDFIKDFAAPAMIGVSAKGLTETLAEGTRLGVDKDVSELARAMQESSLKSMGSAAGVFSAITAYSLIHHFSPKENGPNVAVNAPDHLGTIKVEKQQQR